MLGCGIDFCVVSIGCVLFIGSTNRLVRRSVWTPRNHKRGTYFLRYSTIKISPRNNPHTIDRSNFETTVEYGYILLYLTMLSDSGGVAKGAQKEAFSEIRVIAFRAPPAKRSALATFFVSRWMFWSKTAAAIDGVPQYLKLGGLRKSSQPSSLWIGTSTSTKWFKLFNIYFKHLWII